MREILIIPWNNENQMEIIECDKPSLSELQDYVGGYVETVPTTLAPEWMRERNIVPLLIVNEDGKLKNLPYNDRATILMQSFNDCICGDAVVLGAKKDDFIGFKPGVCARIKKSWS